MSGEYHIFQTHAVKSLEKFGLVLGFVEVADDDNSMIFSLKIA